MKRDTMSSQWNILNSGLLRHETVVSGVALCFYHGSLYSNIHWKVFCTWSLSLSSHATLAFAQSLPIKKKLHQKKKKTKWGKTESFFVPSQKIFQKKKILSGRCDKLATWSHAGLRGGGWDHAATVLAEERAGEMRSLEVEEERGPRFTSPPGWGPYCWGCPVTARTEKSRRFPMSSRESPTQRRTPGQGESHALVR